MPLGCFQDIARMPPRCLLDASWMLFASWMPLGCLSDASRMLLIFGQRSDLAYSRTTNIQPAAPLRSARKILREDLSLQQRNLASRNSLAFFNRNTITKAELSAKLLLASSALAKAVLGGLLQRASIHQAAQSSAPCRAQQETA